MEAVIIPGWGYAHPTVWTTGFMGQGALRASEVAWDGIEVDTGWGGMTTSSFTVAFAIKLRPGRVPDNASTFYNIGAQVPLRCRAGNRIGNGTIQSSGVGSEVSLTRDTLTPASTRWVHIACVFDLTRRTAQFFVDGAPEPPTTNAGAWLRSGGTGLPRLGNGAYGLALSGFPNSLFSVAAGTSRLQFGSLPLPFDLGQLDPS